MTQSSGTGRSRARTHRVNDWHARLRRLIMAAPDPDGAAREWASVLSGRATGDEVELGDGTGIVVLGGPRHGLVEVQFDAAGPLLEAVDRAGAEPDRDTLLLRDPDGWAVRFTEVAQVEPMRLPAATLSHCTLLSPNPMRQCEFWQRAGFLLSDTIGEIFSWLRPNPVHHSLAFAAGRTVGIHHLAVEVSDPAALIAAMDALVAAGGQVEFGPGRHLVGGNLFAYVLDRRSIRWELCTGLQRLAPGEPPRRHPEEMRVRSVNVFGPRPPASFLEQPGGPGPLQDQTVSIG